jgi:hypothetical protein
MNSSVSSHFFKPNIGDSAKGGRGQFHNLTADFPIGLVRAPSLTSRFLTSSGLMSSCDNLLLMSEKSEVALLQSANFKRRHWLKLIQRQFLAVLLARFFKSFRRIPLRLLRQLMTIGIPRHNPGIMELQKPQISCGYLQKLFEDSPPNSVLLSHEGKNLNVLSGTSIYSKSSQSIRQMENHPTLPFIFMVDVIGQVWIGRTDDLSQKMLLIYGDNFDIDDRATTCAFDSRKPILVIGLKGKILFFKFSESLVPMVCRQIVIFSSRTEKFSVNHIVSHPNRKMYIVVSDCGFVKTIFLNSEFEARSEINISSRLQLLAPKNPLISCACFLPHGPNGESIVTGDRDGNLSHWSLKILGDRIAIAYQDTKKFFGDGCQISKMNVCPLNPRIIAVHLVCQGFNTVCVVKTSLDGSSPQIIRRFPSGYKTQFYGRFLLIQVHGSIELHLLKDDCKLVEVLGFTPSSGQIESCVLTAVNGRGIIRYSLRGSAAQFFLQLNGIEEYSLYF